MKSVLNKRINFHPFEKEEDVIFILYWFRIQFWIPISASGSSKRLNKRKQAGAEPGQAQFKLGLAKSAVVGQMVSVESIYFSGQVLTFPGLY